MPHFLREKNKQVNKQFLSQGHYFTEEGKQNINIIIFLCGILFCFCWGIEPRAIGMPYTCSTTTLQPNHFYTKKTQVQKSHIQRGLVECLVHTGESLVS